MNDPKPSPIALRESFRRCVAVSLLLALTSISISVRGPASAESNPLRFGVLFWHESPNDFAALSGIRTALAECGRAHELIVRQADSNRDRATAILKELVDLDVDLIFAMGTEAALLAKDLVTDLPVVFTAVTNPVASKVVPSWSGSGLNLAGNSNWIGPETVVEVFRLAVPGLNRLGILRSKTSGLVSAAELAAMREHLDQTDAELTISEQIVDHEREIPDAIEKLVAAKVQAIWIPIDFLVYQNLETVLATVRPHGLPLVSSSLKGAQAGAVAGILVDYEMLGKRALVIALRILDEKLPAGSLPVTTMSAYQVVINLGAARDCGYELPLTLLALADLILDDDSSPGGR